MATTTEYCEYITGLPRKFYNFIVDCTTAHNSPVQFYSDAPIEIDWGDGKSILYDAGTVFGYQVISDGSKIIVRSTEPVTEFRFGSSIGYDNSFLTIDVVKAFDLATAKNMCYHLESLHTFTFMSGASILSFESAWEGCSELLHFVGIDMTRAVSIKRAWMNCNKLVEFPSVYATKCLTVESAWQGCTSMVEFPYIEISSCQNFDNAWRANINLQSFPLIDTGSGTSFDHSWAYCTHLVNFPQLDFKNALDVKYMFAYMHRVTVLPFVDTPLCESFWSLFRKNLSLGCISGIDTNSYENDSTSSMFLNTPLLTNPNTTEQEAIKYGDRYENDNPCYYDAGRSVFFVHCGTDGNPVSFTVTGGDIEVDWGDGTYIPYNEGTIDGMPIYSNAVNIRSEENVSSIVFHTPEVWTSVEVKRSQSLKTYRNMCNGLYNITYFEILGINNSVSDFSGMLQGCSSLKAVDYVDFSTGVDFTDMMNGCESFEGFEDDTIDLHNGLNFTNMFRDCRTVTHLPTFITTIGTTFNGMFSYCELLECIDGLDTRNQLSTVDMFNQCPVLSRPTAGEKAALLTGSFYTNNGYCGGTFSMDFTGTETTLQLDSPAYIDWGDGNVIVYAASMPITGTPIGIATVLSDCTAIDFVTDTVTTIDITRGLLLNDINLSGHTTLESFVFSGLNGLTTLYNMFLGCTALVSSDIASYEGIESFEGMFSGCTSLTSVGDITSTDGLYFENMFLNCTSLVCIGEIDTCKGLFPASMVSCARPTVSCASGSMLDCSPGSMVLCAYKIPCTTMWDKFLDSTMFDGATLITSPNSDERQKITNRYHFVSPNC